MLDKAVLRTPPDLSELEQSEKVFEHLLDRNNDVLALLHLSQIAGMRGQPDDALVRLEQAHSADPSNRVVLTLQAQTYLASENYVAAVAALRELGAANTIAQLVFELYDTQKISVDQAVWIAEQAVLTDPRSSQAWAQLGWTSYLQKRDFGVASEALGKAIELDPHNWYPLLRLADILVHHEHVPERAKPYALELVRRWPELDLAHAIMGDVWVALGETGPAEAEYVKAVSISPGTPHIVVRLADLYDRTGRTEQAVLLWERVVSSSPLHWQYRLRLAAAYLAAGQRDRALSQLRQVQREHPDDVNTRQMLVSMGEQP